MHTAGDASAPSSRSLRAVFSAKCLVPATTALQPESGPDPLLSDLSPRCMAAVSPTTRIPGVGAFSASDAMVPRVPSTRSSSGLKPLIRTAAGVSGALPFSMSLSVISRRERIPIRKTSVPFSAASAP